MDKSHVDDELLLSSVWERVDMLVQGDRKWILGPLGFVYGFWEHHSFIYLFVKTLFLFFLMHVSLHVYLCTMLVPGVQKRVLDSL